MTEERKTQKLSDLIEIKHGYAFKSSQFEKSQDDSLHIVLTPGNYTEDATLEFNKQNTKRLIDDDIPESFLFEKGELTIVMTDLSSKMKILGKPAFISSDNILHNQRIGRIVFKCSNLEPRYLYFYLTTKLFLDNIKETATGTMVRHTAPKRILSNRLLLPPLSEQKRIVVILDEAFGAIARAKENAARNLANARELFDSYLNRVFTEKGEGWEDASIEQCFKVRSGDFLPKKKMDPTGAVPVYGGNGKTGTHSESNLSGSNVIIGRVGAKCGNVRSIHQPIWLTDNAFYVSQFYHEFDHDFLSTVLNWVNLRDTANQAAQPVISYQTIKSVVIPFQKNISDQIATVQRFDDLSQKVSRLEKSYKQKLAALDELKQSLLQ